MAQGRGRRRRPAHRGDTTGRPTSLAARPSRRGEHRMDPATRSHSRGEAGGCGAARSGPRRPRRSRRRRRSPVGVSAEDGVRSARNGSGRGCFARSRRGRLPPWAFSGRPGSAARSAPAAPDGPSRPARRARSPGPARRADCSGGRRGRAALLARAPASHAGASAAALSRASAPVASARNGLFSGRASPRPLPGGSFGSARPSRLIPAFLHFQSFIRRPLRRGGFFRWIRVTLRDRTLRERPREAIHSFHQSPSTRSGSRSPGRSAI